jgi:hypothetical protein
LFAYEFFGEYDKIDKKEIYKFLKFSFYVLKSILSLIYLIIVETTGWLGFF